MSYEARSVARLVAAVLLVFLLGLPVIASAAPSYQARFANAESVIRAHEPTIIWWEQQSQISVAIGLTIAALGIAIGVLQTLAARWTKPATLAIGASIAAIAAFNAMFFDADARTLGAKAREARALIASAERFIALAPALPTDEDREEALGYIQQSAEALALLSSGGSKGRTIAPADRSASRFLSPFTTLYAAGSGCACAAPDHQDTAEYRYFCGQGTARSLAEARAMATEEALVKASRALRKHEAKSPAADVTSYVRSVSDEVAACPVSGSKGMTLFVLLRVPTALTSSNAQHAFNPPRWE